MRQDPRSRRHGGVNATIRRTTVGIVRMMHLDAESNGKDSILRLPNTKMSHMHPHGISNNPAESIKWQYIDIAGWEIKFSGYLG